MRGKRFSFQGSYKGWHFRSLKELSFVLLCEKNGVPWEGAEKKEYSVLYTDPYGKVKRHYPDFLINRDTIVEVKPTKHQNGKIVKAKAEAMKAFCDKKGWKYLMVSPRVINATELKTLVDNGTVIIDEGYREQMNYYLKRRNA